MDLPTETIFEDIGETEDRMDMRGNPRTGQMEDTYSWRVRMLIEDARQYDRTYRRPAREQFARYYNGDEPFLDEDGRSTIVITDVRDTILAIMPSLMRIFTARQNPVEFVPNFKDAAPKAEEATDYVRHCFMEDNPGFMIIHDLLKDSLIKGEGIVKWWTDVEQEVTYQHYHNLSAEEVAFVLQQYPQAEVVRQQPTPGPTGIVFELEIKLLKSKPLLRVVNVPPEEYRIDRRAKNVKTAKLVGHERVETVSDILKMGYTEDEIESFRGLSSASLQWNEERTLRNRGLAEDAMYPDINDCIMFGEYWVQIDSDGDGIDELHYIHTMGDNDIIMRDEIVDTKNILQLTPDPEPHTHAGHSVTELVNDLQKIKTNLMRNSLDSLAQTIYPRLKIMENMVNVDDVLNTELGAPIRVRDMGAVEQLEHHFIGDAPLNFMNYLDLIATKRTGISDASKGLDPKALQSTTMKGVDMVISGAQERIELIARILAETGFKDLYKGLLLEITRNPNHDRCIKIRGEFVQVTPSTYDPTMSVQVNPAIGRGSDQDRINLLMMIKATQEQIIQLMGPANPVVSPNEYLNTMQDILSLAGFKQVDRYFKPVPPEVLQAMSQPKPDPALIVAQNEQEKVRSKVAKDVSDKEFQNRKLEMDDEFRKMKLALDVITQKNTTEAGVDAAHVQNLYDIISQDKEHAHEKDMQTADHAAQMMQAEAANEANNESGPQDGGEPSSGGAEGSKPAKKRDF